MAAAGCHARSKRRREPPQVTILHIALVMVLFLPQQKKT